MKFLESVRRDKIQGQMDQRAIGAKIQRLRKQAGLIQDDLAATANISIGALQRIEAGTGNPELKTLAKIADALNCEPWELLKEDPSMKTSSDPERRSTLRELAFPKSAQGAESRTARVDVDDLNIRDAASILNALADLPRSERKIALAVLLNDVSYVADMDPEAEQFVSSLRSVLK